MAKDKSPKKKADKTAALKTPKEKKAEKAMKKFGKKSYEKNNGD